MGQSSGTEVRALASWVAPIAEHLLVSRRSVLEFARARDGSFWELRPRGVDGWTNKDLLAHIGGANDQMVQTVLRAVIAKQPVDRSIANIDTNAANHRAVDERVDWPVERVISEVQSTGDDMQLMLSTLTDDDKGRVLEGLNITLEQLLAVVQAEDHDREHLGQMQATLERAL